MKHTNRKTRLLVQVEKNGDCKVETSFSFEDTKRPPTEVVEELIKVVRLAIILPPSGATK